MCTELSIRKDKTNDSVTNNFERGDCILIQVQAMLQIKAIRQENQLGKNKREKKRKNKKRKKKKPAGAGWGESYSVPKPVGE